MRDGGSRRRCAPAVVLLAAAGCRGAERDPGVIIKATVGHLTESKEEARKRGDRQLTEYELLHLSGSKTLVDDLIDPKTGQRIPTHKWWRAGGAGARVPDQIRLSYAGDSSTAITVSWSTYSPPTRPYVVLAPLRTGVEALGTPLARRVLAHVTNLTRAAVNIEQYVMRAEVTDLAPDTVYAYQCGDWWPSQAWERRGWLSDVHHFRTHPSGQAWSPRLLMFGDLAVDSAVSVALMTEMVKRGTIDSVFHAGDIAYSLIKYSGTVGDRWMRTVAPFAAEVPYMVTAGDHDLRWGRDTWDMQQRFAMPGWRSSAGHPGAVLGRWGGLWWSVDIGPIHVVSYNTEMWHTHHELGIVRDGFLWLKDDLRKANANRKNVPWIVTIAHTPMYTSGYRKRKVRGGKVWNAGWDPLSAKHRRGPPIHPGWRRISSNGTVKDIVHPFPFEKLLYKMRVDLAVQAHWHNYERFYPVYDSNIVLGHSRDPYEDPRAPIHLNIGHAGRGHEPFDRKPLKFSARRLKGRGFGVLRAVSDAELRWDAFECEFDDCKGSLVDRFTITRKGRSTTPYPDAGAIGTPAPEDPPATPLPPSREVTAEELRRRAAALSADIQKQRDRQQELRAALKAVRPALLGGPLRGGE